MQYDPEDDPDTGSATTPADVATNVERDQAEGDDEAAGGAAERGD